MTADTAIVVRRGWPWLLSLAGRALVLVAIAVIALLVYRHGQAALAIAETAPVRLDAVAVFVLAAAVYMIGHGLRALRLALLVGGTRVGLRLITAFHLMTAAAALIAPLKLGEVYRVAELAHVVRDPARALILVWWERVFDVATILGLLVIALAVTPQARAPQFVAIAAASAVFVAATAVIAVLLPSNLSRMSFFIIRRYRSPRSVAVLRMLAAARRTIDEAPRMLRGKTASLSVLSVLIWACELGAFALMAPYLSAQVSAIEGFLGFLSSVTQGKGALCQGMVACAAGAGQTAYVVVTQGVLVVFGLAGGLYYARWRLRQPAREAAT